MKTLLYFSLAAALLAGCHQEAPAPNVTQGSTTEKRIEVSTPGTNVTTVIEHPAPSQVTVKSAPPAASAPTRVDVDVNTTMAPASPAAAPADMTLTPAPETSPVSAGGPMEVTDNGASRTLQTSPDGTVTVQGNDNDLTLSSSVDRLEVPGNNNRINGQGITTISFSGSGNRVTYTGPKPTIEGVQADNVAESR